MARLHSLFFYLFLALIFWLPIPLGSNRPWAWSIMEATIFILLAGVALSSVIYKQAFWAKLKPYLFLLLPITTIQIWIMLQLVPMPLIGASQTSMLSSISVDPSQTYVSLLKGLSYLGLMILTILLVTNEQRIKQLLWTFLASGSFQAAYGVLTLYSGSDTSFIIEQYISHFATGSFYYKNHFANFLLLTTATSIGLLVASLNNKQQLSSRAKLRDFVAALIKGKAVIRISLAILVIGFSCFTLSNGQCCIFYFTYHYRVLRTYLL